MFGMFGDLTLMQFMKDGGIFMWIIAGVLVFSTAVLFERFFVLNFCYPYKERFFKEVIRALKYSEYNEAMKLCRSTTHPLAEVVANVLKCAGKAEDVLESAAHVAIQKIIPRIQRNSNYINLSANVATLFGLLGTIQGLIMAFSSLGTASASAKAALLAKGISTAMYTTAMGLLVAIPLMIIYTIITNKEKNILQKYDETLSEIIHIMAHEKSSRDKRAS
jgi:biopolymer transport protein ExbB